MSITPILCYHAIGDDLPADEAAFAFSATQFAAHLDAIAAQGLRTITISELAQHRRAGDEAALAGTLAITFDDGYADLLTTVAPLLTARSMVATAFVTTSYLDGRSTNREGYERWLTWQQAAELVESGHFEIGGHSDDHVELDMLPLDAGRQQVRRCRDRLRRELGVDVTSFAYPYGYSTAALRDTLPGEGITAACGVKHALSSSGDDLLDLARVRLLRRHALSTVTGWISGRGLRVAPCGDELRTRLFRPVRRMRHTVRARGDVTAR